MLQAAEVNCEIFRKLTSTAYENNVARDIKLVRNRRNEAKRVIPTKAEINILIEKVPECHRPMIKTAIFTGMRLSELRGLTWDCVDFDVKVIRIEKRADRYNTMDKPKSRTRKEVYQWFRLLFVFYRLGKKIVQKQIWDWYFRMERGMLDVC